MARRHNSAPKQPRFTPKTTSDPRYQKYQAEFNDPKTSQARKDKINAAWHFGSQNNGQGIEQSPGTGETVNSGYDLKTASGIIGAQNDMNDVNLQKNIGVNRFNTKNDFGSQNWQIDPVTGQMTQVNQLNDAQGNLLASQNKRNQGLQDLSNAQLGGVANTLKNPYDLSGVGNDPSKFDFSKQRQAAEDRIMKRFSDVNEPIFKKQQEDFDEQMIQRGIPRDSAQYQREKANLDRNQNDARQSAQTNAFQFGQGEESQAFGQGMQAHQSGVQDYNMGRQGGLDEMTKVLGITGGPTIPQYQQAASLNLPQTDVEGVATHINDQNWQGGQNDADRQNRIDTAHASKGPSFSPMDYAQANSWLYNQNAQTQNKYYQDRQPSTGQQIGSTAGNILGNVIGAAAGAYMLRP